MSTTDKVEAEVRIKLLSEQGKSSRVIVKELKDAGIAVSQSTVIRVIGAKTKKRLAAVNGISAPTFKRTKRVRYAENVRKVKKMITCANPPSQRAMGKKLGTSPTTIRAIIRKDLGAHIKQKTRVHLLTPSHKQNRKTNARKLYERHLAGDKTEFMVTLDEAYVYLDYCNGVRKICYAQPGQEVPNGWLVKCHERWPLGFMIVGGMTGRGTLPLIKVPKKVKINAAYYIKHVLKPYLEREVPLLYPGELAKVTLHHDKASSHTANLTTAYLQDLKDQTGINYIAKEEIPTKSPDISPMDFYGFGFLKQRLFLRQATTLQGLWKVLKDEWGKVTPEMCKTVFDTWKRRCRAVSQKHGEHIEQTKDIHRRILREKN